MKTIFIEVTPQKRSAKVARQLFGQVWENLGGNPLHPQKCACSYTYVLSPSMQRRCNLHAFAAFLRFWGLALVQWYSSCVRWVFLSHVNVLVQNSKVFCYHCFSVFLFKLRRYPILREFARRPMFSFSSFLWSFNVSITKECCKLPCIFVRSRKYVNQHWKSARKIGTFFQTFFYKKSHRCSKPQTMSFCIVCGIVSRSVWFNRKQRIGRQPLLRKRVFDAWKMFSYFRM